MELNCILVKVSPEVSLKSRFVRKYFFDKLVSSIKTVLRANHLSGTKIIRGNGRLFIFPAEKEKIGPIFSLLGFVFGIQSFSRAFFFEFKKKEEVVEKSVLFAKKNFSIGSFMVDARREGFEGFTSKEFEETIGSKVLESIKGLTVNLEEPDNTLFLEVYKSKAFIYNSHEKGAGGLPVGCEGNVAVFFEGKKEELAAAFLMLKRGCNVFPIAKKFDKKLKMHVNKLCKWNSFRSFMFSEAKNLGSLIEKNDISVKAIVFSDSVFSKKMLAQKKDSGLAVLWPLAFIPKTITSSLTGVVLGD